MIKKLNKAIKIRSRLRNKYLKEKSAGSKSAHDKQKNTVWIKLLFVLT